MAYCESSPQRLCHVLNREARIAPCIRRSSDQLRSFSQGRSGVVVENTGTRAGSCLKRSTPQKKADHFIAVHVQIRVQQQPNQRLVWAAAA